jgi:hypothetical protein
MTNSELLETTRSWASQRFAPEAGQFEVSEKPAAPPFVDLHAGMPSAPADPSGVFFGLKHVDGAELQVWVPAGGQGGAYTMFDVDDGEVQTMSLPSCSTTSELEHALTQVTDRFFFGWVFERALEIWLHNATYGGRFVKLTDFASVAAHAEVNPQDWAFIELPTSAAEDAPVHIIGVHGSGMAATFHTVDAELERFTDFDQTVRGLQNSDQLQAWIESITKS